jgi:multicomponent Na+:H+ antiporter subunit D
VSALLHAVAVVKVGAFGVTRVIYNVFGADLLGDARLHDVPGVRWRRSRSWPRRAWPRQDHLKRRLAYSTISQLSYVLLAASLLTPLAALAAIVHVANQAFAKITMFFVVGAIASGDRRPRGQRARGHRQAMPWTWPRSRWRR